MYFGGNRVLPRISVPLIAPTSFRLYLVLTPNLPLMPLLKQKVDLAQQMANW